MKSNDRLFCLNSELPPAESQPHRARNKHPFLGYSKRKDHTRQDCNLHAMDVVNIKLGRGVMALL